MDWKQEMFKRLDALADKLGTTSQYLWHVLVKQGIAEGASDLFIGVVCCVGAFILYRLLKKLYIAETEEGWDNFGKIWLFILGLVAGIVLTISGVCNIQLGIVNLANPEYFALHEVLQALGK